jgi:hypothetical protein
MGRGSVGLKKTSVYQTPEAKDTTDDVRISADVNTASRAIPLASWGLVVFVEGREEVDIP